MQLQIRKPYQKPHGSLLMLVLWAIAFVSVLIMALLPQIRSHGRQVSASKTEFKLYQLAKRGIEIAKHPNVHPGDPLLSYENGGSSYNVRLTSEERLIPFLRLLEPQHQSSFKTIFARLGLSTTECESLIDAWMDWMDEDSNRRLKGAESSEYHASGLAHLPLNKRFDNWNEVKATMGAELLDQKHPGWEKHFTLFPTTAVDLNEASPEVLHLFTGAELGLCRAYREKRLGNDQKPGTKDDWKAEGVEEALRILGIRSGANIIDQAFLQTQSQMNTIESVATIAGATLGLRAVIDSDKQWKEQSFVPITK